MRQMEIDMKSVVRALRPLALLVALLVALPSTVLAQGVTTGSLTGLVAEQDAVEKELFALQTRVGAMLRANFDLEDRVIAAEKLLPVK